MRRAAPLAAALFAAVLAAAPARAEIPVPALRGRVTDLAELLPPERERRLEEELARFERETSHQIAVLTVSTLEGEPIESFSLRVVETWKLGQKDLDNGLLLVVAAQDRRARVEVGYGLEGVLPDAVAKRVLEDVMFPRFRAGDAAGGIEAAAEALLRAARGEVVPAARLPRPGAAVRGADPLAVATFAAVLATFLWMPFRGGRWRPLGAALGGATSGAITWFLLASLAWAGLAFALGVLFAWMGPTSSGVGRGRGRSYARWGAWPGGFGGGGFGGGGGFRGGGGGFGGGGASGSW